MFVARTFTFAKEKFWREQSKILRRWWKFNIQTFKQKYSNFLLFFLQIVNDELDLIISLLCLIICACNFDTIISPKLAFVISFVLFWWLVFYCVLEDTHFRWTQLNFTRRSLTNLNPLTIFNQLPSFQWVIWEKLVLICFKPKRFRCKIHKIEVVLVKLIKIWIENFSNLKTRKTK